MSVRILGIDIGSIQICAVIAQYDGQNTKILGTGLAKSQGLKKGVITNIDLASKSIKFAVTEAQRIAGTKFERVLVSISGAYTKSVESHGVVNVINNEIGIKEIKRAVEMASLNANVPNDYETLHALPYSFKVDEQDNIEDPLGMNGGRLEVSTHIVMAQKSALNNLKNTINMAGISADNVVLSGYASTIATINSDEKELGVAVIDMGGATCDMVVRSGNSIRFNEFLGVGSTNITNDLSTAIHTPLAAAEDVKINYGSLHYDANELIELPNLGDDSTTKEISLEIVSNVIYARVEETLMILAKMLEDSGYKDYIGAGVVLTGGMTKLNGLRELASAIFDNMPIRLAKPKAMDGLYENIKDPSFSTAVGLVIYGSGGFTPYEIDSKGNMRYKDEIILPPENQTDEMQEYSIEIDEEDFQSTKEKLASIAEIDKGKKTENAIKKFWHRLTQLF